MCAANEKSTGSAVIVNAFLLQAAVLYIFDLSAHCGQTLEEQVSLFNSIKPLFQNKVGSLIGWTLSIFVLLIYTLLLSS